MVPESHQANAVRLYRAERYPNEWVYVQDLVSGAPFSDPTLLHRDGGWWLWAEITTEFTFDNVHLYYADELAGPWTSHPQNPLVSGDPRRARPGGRIVEHDGQLLRFVQDCGDAYGSALRVMEVEVLGRQEYRERELERSPLFEGAGSGWNATGMHHVDPVRLPDGTWIAAVDGWIDQEAP